MPKKFVYTTHALAVMTERRLPAEWIERTARDPLWSEDDPHDPQVQRRFATVPERGGRYLRVACVETDTEIRILTAFLDRKARPR
jgi:hypothetical protein